MTFWNFRRQGLSHDEASHLFGDIGLALKDLLLIIAACLGIVALMFAIKGFRAWQHAEETDAQAKQGLAKLTGEGGTIDEINGLVADIRTKVNAIDAAEINQRVRDTGETQRQLNLLLTAFTNRAEEVRGNMLSLQGVTDQARATLKQDGDAVEKVVLSATSLVDDQRVKIGNAETVLTRAAEGLSTAIETDNPKVAAILDNLKTVTIDADGAVKGFIPLEDHLTGIAGNFEAMSLDSKNKLHELLYPPPVHGVWPNLKRAFNYVLEPILLGGRVYFQLHALSSFPVRLVAPIPTK